MKKMPESPLTKPSRPREAVGPDMTEAISADDLEMLFQIFKPRGDDDWDGEWDHGPSGDADMCEAPLTTKRRKALPASDFALPGRRYPIDTPARARAALARGKVNASPEEYRRIVRAVKRRYPKMDVSEIAKNS